MDLNVHQEVVVELREREEREGDKKEGTARGEERGDKREERQKRVTSLLFADSTQTDYESVHCYGYSCHGYNTHLNCGPDGDCLLGAGDSDIHHHTILHWPGGGLGERGREGGRERGRERSKRGLGERGGRRGEERWVERSN